jgi:hypothetical protein
MNSCRLPLTLLAASAAASLQQQWRAWLIQVRVHAGQGCVAGSNISNGCYFRWHFLDHYTRTLYDRVCLTQLHRLLHTLHLKRSSQQSQCGLLSACMQGAEPHNAQGYQGTHLTSKNMHAVDCGNGRGVLAGLHNACSC